MRSSQVYRALNHVPNRFTLCQTISQSARRIHMNGSPLQGTVTLILERIGDKLFHGQVKARLSQDDNNAAPREALLVA